MASMQLSTACLAGLVFLALGGPACASNPDSKEVVATWEVYIPAGACDDGEPVANGETPVQGGATVSCVNSPPVDKLPEKSTPDQRGSISIGEIGTVIVMGLSQEQVILAADSRGSRVDLTTMRFLGVDDSTCKVAALRPNLLFAVTGLAKTNSSLPANIYFDAIDLAREAAKNFKFDARWMKPNDTVKEIAAQWGWDVAFHIRRGVKTGSYYPLGPTWVRGIFAGLEPNGAVSTAIANLEYHPPRPGMIVPVVSLSITFDFPLKTFTIIEAYGRDGVANKYLQRNGPEDVRVEHLRIRAEQLRSPRRFSAAPIERLVKLTEERDDLQWPDGSKLVGGETDIARLRRNGTVEWLHRKKGLLSRTVAAS